MIELKIKHPKLLLYTSDVLIIVKMLVLGGKQVWAGETKGKWCLSNVYYIFLQVTIPRTVDIGVTEESHDLVNLRITMYRSLSPQLTRHAWIVEAFRFSDGEKSV